MKEQIVDEEIRLIPYYRNDEASLPWYQDADVCKQVDDRDTPYDLELLHDSVCCSSARPIPFGHWLSAFP